SVDWWDYWLGFGVTYPFAAKDFYNSGHAVDTKTDKNDFFFLNPGAYFQFKRFGIGANLDAQDARLHASSGGVSELRVRFVTTHLQAGYLFFDNQLAVGAGAQILGQGVLASTPTSDRLRDVYSSVGAGFETGFVLKPNGARWRIGGSVFGPIRTHVNKNSQVALTPEGDLVINGFYLPRSTESPWRTSIGAAYQFGPRPTNPRWTYVEEYAAEALRKLDEREHELERTRADRLAKL